MTRGKDRAISAIRPALIALIGICAAVFLISLYVLYQLVARDAERGYQIDVGPQQHRAATIQSARDLVVVYDKATDPQRKATAQSEFCTTYEAIQPVPADLAFAHDRIC